uniref:L1 transposable element RRM domain-containing protein n=1 Tax=Panthera leo TaxID=9689 RepID=A0A8C9CUJ6_PANLE
MEVATVGIEDAEDRIGELEDKTMEKEEAEKKRDKKKIQEYEGRIRELSDKIKQNNIQIIGIKKKKREITTENFPNLGEKKGIEIQEARRTPFGHNLNESFARHIILKLAKYKDTERIMKPARDKQVLTYKGRHKRVVADLYTETWQARKEICSVMNRKNMQPRIFYPASLSFRIEGEIKVFPNKQKLKEFITTKPALQEILRGSLGDPKGILRGSKGYSVSEMFQGPQSTRDTTSSMKPTNITMTLNPYLSIITLNVSGINAPTKRHRVSE